MDEYELRRRFELEREARLRQLYRAQGMDDPWQEANFRRSYPPEFQQLLNEMYKLRQEVHTLRMTGGMQIINQDYKKEEKNMSGIVTFLKLDKDQRELNKAGILDDSGILTEEGQEVLLNILIQSKEFKSIILEAAKEYNKGKKKKD